jgi:hypothetical protein
VRASAISHSAKNLSIESGFGFLATAAENPPAWLCAGRLMADVLEAAT